MMRSGQSSPVGRHGASGGNEYAIALWEPVRWSTPPARLLNDLGWSYHFAGRYAEARATLEEAICLDPDDPDAHRGLGWTLTGQRHYASAIGQFTTAIDIADPVDCIPLREAYQGRAWAHFNLGELRAAKDDFASALKLTAESDTSALQDVERGLGWIGLQLGEGRRAANHFRRALEALGDRRGAEYEDARAGLERATAKGKETAAAQTVPT